MEASLCRWRVLGMVLFCVGVVAQQVKELGSSKHTEESCTMLLEMKLKGHQKSLEKLQLRMQVADQEGVEPEDVAKAEEEIKKETGGKSEKMDDLWPWPFGNALRKTAIRDAKCKTNEDDDDVETWSDAKCVHTCGFHVFSRTASESTSLVSDLGEANVNCNPACKTKCVGCACTKALNTTSSVDTASQAAKEAAEANTTFATSNSTAAVKATRDAAGEPAKAEGDSQRLGEGETFTTEDEEACISLLTDLIKEHRKELAGLMMAEEKDPEKPNTEDNLKPNPKAAEADDEKCKAEAGGIPDDKQWDDKKCKRMCGKEAAMGLVPEDKGSFVKGGIQDDPGSLGESARMTTGLPRCVPACKDNCYGCACVVWKKESTFTGKDGGSSGNS